MKQLLYIALALALTACGTSGKQSHDRPDTLYAPRYAEGFALLSYGDSPVLSVRNPWQGAEDIELQYFLSRNGQLPPAGFEGIVLNVPLQRVVCMSSSYVAFIDKLGCLERVKGVSGAKYIFNPAIRDAYASGEVKEVGQDSAMNYELLAALRPDAVFVYGVAGQSSVISQKTEELGIPVVYIGEYLETSPLGKAEWLAAFGAMFGQEEQAAAEFQAICDNYQSICALTADVAHRPEVMLNSPWRDTWFVPGDLSYMAALIRDAGGLYACRGEQSSRSRPLANEKAYVIARASDFWLNPGSAHTLGELTAENPNFANIPAVEQRRVYNNNLRCTPGGGSDFWEAGAVMPDVILADIAAILHPELMPDHELYFYKQLK